jgi:hypothetical protein
MPSYTMVTAGYVAPAVVGLTDAATIAVDAALGNDFRVTIKGSRIMAGPTQGTDGQRITFQITQGSGGNFLVTWGSLYSFGAAGSPKLSAAAGKTDLIGFVFNASLNKWLCAGYALGF